MHSLTVALHSLIVLIFLSELCKGDTVDDSTVVGLKTAVVSPFIRKDQVLNREIRSPSRKKKNNNSKNKEKRNSKTKKQNNRKNNQKRNKKIKKQNKRNSNKKRNNKTGKKNSRKSNGKRHNKLKKQKSRKNMKNKNNSKNKNKSKRKNNIKNKNKHNRKKNGRKQNTPKRGKNNKNNSGQSFSKKNQRNKQCKIDTDDCAAPCKRALNFDRQIVRIDKKYDNIVNKKAKKDEYIRSSATLLNHARKNCVGIPANFTSEKLKVVSENMLNCSKEVEATCVSLAIPTNFTKNGTCHRQILDLKAECKTIDEFNQTQCSSSSEVDWKNCKPTTLAEETVTLFKKCTLVTRRCKVGVKFTEIAGFHFSNCTDNSTVVPSTPPVVTKTVVEENGEIVEQVNSFYPDTGEVSTVVPAHGNFEETTFIMDKESGTLVTSTADACRIRPIPADIDINNPQTRQDEASETTLITAEQETKTYTLVIDGGAATVADIAKLSPVMTKECANKPIKKTVEKKVDKETFEKFQNGSLSRMDLGRQGRQNSCENPSEICAYSPRGGCMRWPNLKGQQIWIHAAHLDGWCIPCCNTSNTEVQCACSQIKTLEQINKCALQNGTCPPAFINFCGKCYLDQDYRDVKIPPCNGECPENYEKCGNECISPGKARNYRTCGDQCLSNYYPCDGKCPDDRTLCGNRCESTKNTWTCDNGKCRYLWQPCLENCDEICPRGRIYCNGYCENAKYYKPCNNGQCVYFLDKCPTCTSLTTNGYKLKNLFRKFIFKHKQN